MVASDRLTVEVRVTPGEDTMRMVLALLNLWQDAHPGKMVALVPDREKYVYEVIERGGDCDESQRE